MKKTKDFCLSIAGWDPSANAGVLADVQVFGSLGWQAAAAITAVTAQNRSRVLSVHPVPAAWLVEQLQALLEEGNPAGVKVGMLGSAAVTRVVARFVAEMDERGIPVVVDPVLRATAGAPLLDRPGIEILRQKILCSAAVITPNVAEAAALLDLCPIQTRAQMERAARLFLARGARAVVIKGGDRTGAPLDLLADGKGLMWLEGPRIGQGTVRGTGCRFSAALAAALAQGQPLRPAIRVARRVVRAHIRSLL